MDDAYDDRFRYYDALLRSLAARLVKQDGVNARLTLAIERIERTLAHGEMTQARIETLLARMIRQGENGRDA